jgi:hypothetical protein
MYADSGHHNQGVILMHESKLYLAKANRQVGEVSCGAPDTPVDSFVTSFGN